MVNNIKELIKQVKDGKIPWDEKVKLESNIKVDKPLSDISPENWKSIRHEAPAWEGDGISLISQISQSNKLFNSEWKFCSKEILEEFRKHINTDAYPTLETKNRGVVRIDEVNENDIVTTNWKSIAAMLRDSHKIYGRDGDNCAFHSEETLRFLQSIIDEKCLQTIEYQAGEEYKLKELSYSAYLEVIQEQFEQNKKENKELKTQIKQLLELKENDELPNNWNELLVKKSDLEKLAEKESKIKNLPSSQTQGELNDKEEKFNKLESEIKELRKKEDELEDEISDLKKKIRKANNDQEKKALEEKLEDVNRELERTQDKLKSNEEARSKLRNEMNTLRDKLKELQSANGNELDKLSYENNQLTLDLNIAKEKIRELENSERNSEQIKEIQEKNNSLTKQLEEAKSELSFLKITNSLNESKDKEVGEMASGLSDSNKKLETQKVEKDKLENKITDKEQQKQTLENEGKIDSEEYKKLLTELEELRKKLESVDQEIEKSRRQVANLKEQLNSSYQSLQEEIEVRGNQFKEVKENCLNKLKESQTWYSKLINDNDIDKLVETLLKAQKEITRDSNDNFAPDEKKRIIDSIPKELTEELNALCTLQDYLTQLEIKKENIEKAGQALKIVMIAPVTPPQLSNKKNDLEDIYDDIKESFDYDKVLSESSEFILQKSCKLEKLPTRLYSIKENKIKKTENKSNIDNYAILSYVWGEPGELLEKDKKELDNLWSSIGYKNELNPSGYKSLKKAVQTCKLLGIDYLWMDQLCTNQGDNEDKNQEVPKMRQYYFNSAVTLIAIHRNLNDEEVSKGVESEKVLEKVIRSKWFSRSWTFQEGWLSKQTIFMFDSHLIDGSLLANRWVLGQPSYAGSASYKSVLDKGSQKIATPLGWVHYREGYNEEDKISFTLNQALRAIKNRGRGASIDGIYSILGLLPYGDKVKVEYKKWGERYEKKDLEKALFNVMLTAMKESGYNEYFAWHGLGDGWLPEVYDEGDYNLKRTAGGTSIEGGMSIIHKEFEEPDLHSGIEVTTSKYIIRGSREFGREEEKDKGSVIDSGACTGNVLINSASDSSQKVEEIKLLGTSDLFEKKMKEGDILLLLNKKEWKSNKPFALIIRKKENDDSYQRIGLAEISEKDLEKLQKVGKEEKLTIKIDESNMNVKITDHPEQKLETNIEIPSK